MYNMYNIRIPYRRMAFAKKGGEFTTKVELSDRTKKEITAAYKDYGVLVSFDRGFITIEAGRNEISDSVFSRAHNEVETME